MSRRESTLFMSSTDLPKIRNVILNGQVKLDSDPSEVEAFLVRGTITLDNETGLTFAIWSSGHTSGNAFGPSTRAGRPVENATALLNELIRVASRLSEDVTAPDHQISDADDTLKFRLSDPRLLELDALFRYHKGADKIAGAFQDEVADFFIYNPHLCI